MVRHGDTIAHNGSRFAYVKTKRWINCAVTCTADQSTCICFCYTDNKIPLAFLFVCFFKSEISSF